MAIVKRNPLIDGLSGKVGGFVFKQHRQTTVLSIKPDCSKVKLSDKQVRANGKFKLAVVYAKGVLRDPEKCKAIEAKLQPGRSVYHTALAEFLRNETSP